VKNARYVPLDTPVKNVNTITRMIVVDTELFVSTERVYVQMGGQENDAIPVNMGLPVNHVNLVTR
jgi:hypothetical protein